MVFRFFLRFPLAVYVSELLMLPIFVSESATKLVFIVPLLHWEFVSPQVSFTDVASEFVFPQNSVILLGWEYVFPQVSITTLLVSEFVFPHKSVMIVGISGNHKGNNCFSFQTNSAYIL